MYIANINNCWFTNLGEAFIDIGVKEIIKNIQKRHRNIKFGAISTMNQFYLSPIMQENKGTLFNNSDFFTPDLLILPGMMATSEFYEIRDNRLRITSYALELKRRGSQIVFLGMGGWEYSRKEKEDFLKILKLLDPLFIITRDEKTYNMYKDYVECIKGLDCCFWVDEGFDPRGLNNPGYIVSTFNRSDEPDEIQKMKNLIHPWHMMYYMNERYTKYLSKENLFMSDSPYEYLTIYANAKKVYTDLVHATIPSLLYGTPVKYYDIDNRKDAFLSLEYLEKDDEGFLSIDANKLKEEKLKIEKYIEKKLFSN